MGRVTLVRTFLRTSRKSCVMPARGIRKHPDGEILAIILARVRPARRGPRVEEIVGRTRYSVRGLENVLEDMIARGLVARIPGTKEFDVTAKGRRML